MEIRENLEEVRERIYKAALAANRDPETVTLIAVSKTKPMAMVREAMRCGALDFGENRPQELAEKYSQAPDARWHQIGRLQRNKVRLIIDKTALIHSLDSLPLAQEIEKRAAAIQKVQDVLVQVNVSGEASKAGVSPEEAPALCAAAGAMPHLRVLGLMTISVKDMDPEGNFKIFSGLRKLAEDIETQALPGVSMKELSMGMSHDFEAAIAAGSTMVRVGTGIFGARDNITL